MRPRVTIGSLSLALCAAAAAASVVFALPLHAARAKPRLEVAFGPQSVEAQAPQSFVLSLRNAGDADAVLMVGDRIDVTYPTGADPADLVAATSRLDADATAEFDWDDATAGRATLLPQSTITLAPGDSRAFVLRGVTSVPGVSTVQVDVTVSKPAGKVARTQQVAVAKTPAREEGFYGDGSNGSPTIVDGADLRPLANYVDFIVPAGATVTAPSGTTIRCTGRFENLGTIVVAAGAPGGGTLGAIDASEVRAASIPWGRGDAKTYASEPGVAQGEAAAGALGGAGLGNSVHALPLSHYRAGGGGGSGALGGVGGAGGGVLRVLARGVVRNAGTIVARGAAPAVNRTGQAGFEGGGAGGGGGGVVILASGVRVENPGTIDVTGGDGGRGDFFGGAGGGGGGGLVLFVAPEAAASLGNALLAGGDSGLGVGTASFPVWAGGGGGGGSVGDGAAGAAVGAAGDIGAAPQGTGGPGLAIERVADPRTLWR